jgi:peptide/nickel transport system substrate-binding protein
VVPDGTTTCVKPGTGAGECGTGIAAREGISFNVDYAPLEFAQDEMNDLKEQARRVGINISLTTHSSNTVNNTPACTPNQRACRWTAENPIAGTWLYGPDYLPTGEDLYKPNTAFNPGSYSDTKMTQLIQATITGPASQEAPALTAYARYVQRQLPVVFEPTRIGTYAPDSGTLVSNKLGGYAANAFGLMNPEDWYFTR